MRRSFSRQSGVLACSSAFAALVALTSLITACGGSGTEPGENAGVRAQALEEYVDEAGKLDEPESQPKTEIPCEGECPEDGQVGTSYCTYKRYTETKRFDKFVALQPNSATLWPGSMVRAADARNGLLTPVGAKLAPVTFSFSLENITASPVGTMETPSLSAFRDERNRILGEGVTGATPAAIDFKVEQINSASQIAVAIGAGANWPGGLEISGSFNFSKDSKKTKMLVDFTQAYYTIDVDTPASVADFFAPEVTVDDIDDKVGKGNPPLYVQSITYGRRVIFSVESEASASSIEAALKASYKSALGVGPGGNVDVSASDKKTLDESSISAFVLGGSGTDAVAAVGGFEGIVEFIKKGGDYSKDSPGAPIAYKLAYLDNAATQLAFTTDYAEASCSGNSGKLTAELVSFKHTGGEDDGENIEVYGYVQAVVPTIENPVTECFEGKVNGGTLLDLFAYAAPSEFSMPEFGTKAPPPNTQTVANAATTDGNLLCLFASLAESDAKEGSSDDSFGSMTMAIPFESGWSGDRTLAIHGPGTSSIEVVVRITTE